MNTVPESASFAARRSPPDMRKRRHLDALCIFCGTRSGHDSNLVEQAQDLGRAVASAGIRLIYGGGREGLMGAAAQSAAQSGGDVVAVVPEFMVDRLPMLAEPHRLIRVPDMHSRNATMYALADAFVALPGGAGTVEELAEVVTWQRPEEHAKPMLIANFQAHWSPLLAMYGQLERTGFMDLRLSQDVLITDTAQAIIPSLQGAAYFGAGTGASRGPIDRQ